MCCFVALLLAMKRSLPLEREICTGRRTGGAFRQGQQESEQTSKPESSVTRIPPAWANFVRQSYIVIFFLCCSSVRSRSHRIRIHGTGEICSRIGKQQEFGPRVEGGSGHQVWSGP